MTSCFARESDGYTKRSLMQMTMSFGGNRMLKITLLECFRNAGIAILRLSSPTVNSARHSEDYLLR